MVSVTEQTIAGNNSSSRVIFLSYRSVDDEPPPENPKGRYVEYLWRQLRWELNRLGVPKATLWRDRCEIEPGDNWSDVIRQELHRSDLFVALLSRNYIESDWCNEEINTMASRVAMFDDNLRDRRIFRVDKNRVLEERIPAPLQGIQAVRFYDEDKEYKREVEYFYRGKIEMEDKYFDAVRALAEGIYRRLDELGVPMKPALKPAKILPIKSNGRIVFVAKPARDMVCNYNVLTTELIKSGYQVVPDVDKEFPDVGEDARALILHSLAQAELSIHLLGERTGVRPDGLESDIVPFQLICAEEVVRKRAGFYRIIWAPKIISSNTDSQPNQAARDPFTVLGKFGSSLDTDQVDSDLPAKFNEFVIQRLERGVLDPMEKPDVNTNATVYLHCLREDRSFALKVAKELKKNGYAPIVRPEFSEHSLDDRNGTESAIISLAGWVVLCWEKSTQPAVFRELLNPVVNKWGRTRGKGSITLIIGPPNSEAKMEVIDLGGIGEEIATVINATDENSIADIIKSQLLPRLESDRAG
jgi:hypothetical protein